MRCRSALVSVLAAVALAAAACGGGGSSETGLTETGGLEPPATTQQESPSPGKNAPKVQVPVPKAGEAIGPLSPAKQVQLLQRALKELGFAIGKPDGQWGPKTQKAVKRFQRKHKLGADGLVGPRTAKAINTALQKQAQGA